MDAAVAAARERLSRATPLKMDCGRVCGARCCRPLEGEETGMLLFPGEAEAYAGKSGWQVRKTARGDLVICPGTAFDESGSRLGMGAGYYDRFLPKCVNAVFVLAAFEAQRADEVPQEETDVPMDLIVTEETVRRIRKGGTP